jgi:hypothetical protein
MLLSTPALVVSFKLEEKWPGHQDIIISVPPPVTYDHLVEEEQIKSKLYGR